jgi:hypothetical protein
MHQNDHEAWNARNYPGTRQLCCKCEQPTGRCEEDSIHREDEGPFCEECRDAFDAQANNPSQTAAEKL